MKFPAAISPCTQDWLPTEAKQGWAWLVPGWETFWEKPEGNKITVYGIWMADDTICSSSHHDFSDSMPVQRNAGKLPQDKEVPDNCI